MLMNQCKLCLYGKIAFKYKELPVHVIFNLIINFTWPFKIDVGGDGKQLIY